MKRTKIGIISIASSLPKKIVTAANVSSFSGFPEEEIISKLGFKQKRVASADEHPSKFALNAAKKALRDSNINAIELNFIIYCSNGVYDYQFWSPSAYLQNKIKARNAITFEINNGCNAATAGIFLAKNLGSIGVSGSYATSN
jgi:3-oxoacyl-[acyl-carrier-protein] synthase III